MPWLDICLIEAIRNPHITNGIRRPVYGHGRLLRTPIVQSERLPEEAAGPGLTSTLLLPRNLEEETARRNSENIMRISRARPGRRPVRLETRWRGRADVAWDCNLAGLVGLGPVILKISPTGPGAGCQAPSARPSSTPPPRVGPARKNRWISSIGFFRT